VIRVARAAALAAILAVLVARAELERTGEGIAEFELHGAHYGRFTRRRDLFSHRTGLTFSRSSEAAAVDPRTGWLWYDTATPWPSSDVARVLPDGAILIEGAATCRLKQNSAYSTSPWGTFGSTVTAGQSSPDGGTGACRVQSHAGDHLAPEQASYDGSDITRACSMYVRKGSGSGNWTMLNFGAAFGYPDHYLNGTAGSSWVRVSMTPNPGLSFYLMDGRASTDLTGGGSVPAQDTDAVIFNVQCEDGTFVTSPIRTTTTQVTRSADIASRTLPSDMKTTDWMVSIWPAASSAHANATQYIYQVDSSNYLALISGTTLRLRANGNNYDVTGLSYSTLAQLDIAVNFASGSLRIANGATGAVQIYDTWSSAGSTLHIGSDGTTSHFYGVISKPTTHDFDPLDMAPSVFLRGDDSGLSFSGFTWPNPGSAADFTASSNKPTAGTLGPRQSVDFDGSSQKATAGALSTVVGTGASWWAGGTVRIDTNRTSCTSKNNTAAPIIADESGKWGVFAYYDGSSMILFALMVVGGVTKVTPDDTAVAIPLANNVYWEAWYDGRSLYCQLGGGQAQRLALVDAVPDSVAGNVSVGKIAGSTQGWDGDIGDLVVVPGQPTAGSLSDWRLWARAQRGIQETPTRAIITTTTTPIVGGTMSVSFQGDVTGLVPTSGVLYRDGVSSGTTVTTAGYTFVAADIGPRLSLFVDDGTRKGFSNELQYNPVLDPNWLDIADPLVPATSFSSFFGVKGVWTVSVDTGTGTKTATGFNGTPSLTANGSTRLKATGSGGTMASNNKGTLFMGLTDAMATVASVVEYTSSATPNGFGFLRNDSGPLEGLVNATNWRFAGTGNPVSSPALVEIDIDRTANFGITRICVNGVDKTMTDHGTGAAPGGNFANDTFYFFNRGTGGLAWTGTSGCIGFTVGIVTGNAKLTCRAYINYKSGTLF
jgi:hypothetical protein